VYWLSLYVKALRQMPQTLSSEQKLERFLSELACRRDIAASTQNQALNAILFFYRDVLAQPIDRVDALRAKRPAQMRHAPTVRETQALLHAIQDEGGYPTNLIARMLYGCGLRVAEPLNLRIKDVNLDLPKLCIRGAKGGKDRVVSLPLSLVGELAQQMESARAVWKRDKQNAIPVMLPQGLDRKYPEYQFSWPWAWLFPAHHTCRHPRTGAVVRYRIHEANVQRAVKRARRKLGISVLPHELRHGYATHCLERGTNPRAIQQAMGHKSLETIMGYFHAESLSVLSPLESLLPSLEDRSDCLAFDPAVDTRPSRQESKCFTALPTQMAGGQKGAAEPLAVWLVRQKKILSLGTWKHSLPGSRTIWISGGSVRWHSLVKPRQPPSKIRRARRLARPEA
jgi:integrase